MIPQTNTNTSAVTHWKRLTNPNYLGPYAFAPNEEKVVEISGITLQMFRGSSEEKVVAALVGEKPLVLNNTNMALITEALGTPYIENWVGKKITLYVEKVSAFGEMVDGLRVRNAVPKEEPVSLVTVEQCRMIRDLLNALGKTAEKIVSYYAVESLEDLNQTQAITVISNLRKQSKEESK